MTVKKYILLILSLVVFSFSFSQKQNTKITNRLTKEIKYSEKNIYTIWIFYKDKGNNIKSKLETAASVLPKHAIERRKKLMKNKNTVATFYDIPVNENYFRQTVKHITKLRHKSNWLNAISAEADKNQINEIRSLPFVKKIDIVRTSHISKNNSEFNFASAYQKYSFRKSVNYNLNYGNSLNQLEQINVPAAHDLGYNGNGIIICVMDAGFNNLEHQVFANMISENRILGTWDFVNNDTIVDDQNDMGNGDHGTMTLSTIGGFYEGQLIGPAYGAKFILTKTENTDSETTAEEDNWVAATEWAENNWGPDITSTSLGYIDFDDGTGYDASELDGNTATITIGADIAASLGILVVNSAGNEGSGTTTIGAPADGDSVLAVGAVDASGNRASFSSVGPTGDGRIKPEVMAQGLNVTVASPLSADGYKTASGTSFSCPITAGAAAVLMQMVPTASNMYIFKALKMTANNHENPNNDYGWGIINIINAYKYLNGTLETSSLKDKITIFPNPVKNTLYINLADNTENINLKIYNINGQLMYENNYKNKKITVNTSDFLNGIFLLYLNTEKNSYIKKFIISR
ncbi:MAG: S8 family serine peptidase [Chlorobi bacterium]|nr:S8 family serine peptidase [Chlorobiota bacterium]